MVCRIGKASVAATELAFWPGMDDSVWANGRGGMAGVESAGFPVEKHGVDSIWFAVGGQFSLVTCLF